MIDRTRLKEAFDKLSTISQSDFNNFFTWSAYLDIFDDIKALYIDGVGPVNLPLEPNDITELFQKFPLETSVTRQKVLEGNVGCEIDGSKITILPEHGRIRQQNILTDLAYSALTGMLGISFSNLNFTVESKLDSLVICSEGESHKVYFKTINEPGKIGTAVLKLPVKMTQQSGNIVISDGIGETRVDLRDNSHYALAALAGRRSNLKSASFTVDSATGQMTAVIIFHLIWNDHGMFCQNNILSPLCFPELLILTDKIKRALTSWMTRDVVDLSKSKNGEHAEKTYFLCLPVTNCTQLELDMANLTPKDMLVIKCLTSITFIDVHLACIGLKKSVMKVPKSENAAAATSPISWLKFEKAINFPHQIADGILEYAIDAAKNLLREPVLYGFSDDCERLSVPAIVIRPRRIDHMLPSKKIHKLSAEFFMESLTSRLNFCSDKEVLENMFVYEALGYELNHIIGFLKQNHLTAVCLKCFFSRLFDACYRLDDKLCLSSSILNVLVKKQLDIDQLFVCECSHQPYDVNPASSFARFLTKVLPGNTPAVKQLMYRILESEHASAVSEIAFNLLQNGNLCGARETFKFVLDAVRSSVSKPEEFRKLFHVSFVPLALSLHEDGAKPNPKVLDVYLSGMKHLKSAQLAQLVEHLDKLLREERLDCKLFLNEVGSNVLRSRNFTPQEFMKIIHTYRSIGEQQIVKSLWKNACAQCINIFNSGEKTMCPFCSVLRQVMPVGARKNVLAELNAIEELKETLKCSIQKLARYAESFSGANVVQYFYSIISLEDRAELSQPLIIEHFAILFSHFSPKVLEYLLTALFQSKYDLASSKAVTMKAIYRSLLEQISNQALDAFLAMDAAYPLLFSVCFGALDLAQLFLDKLNDATATGKVTRSTKFSAMFHVLRANFYGCSVASSPVFNRDMFNHMMLECLKMLNGPTRCRAALCLESFNLLATSERSFPNSIPACIVQEWQALTKSLTFSETVTVVAAAFDSEMCNQETSLKNLKLMWLIFKHLCSSILSKWEHNGRFEEKLDFNEPSLVLLILCSFWTADEKLIADFSQIINEIQRSFEAFSDVHAAIIREKKIVHLASTSSMHAALAFNDVIDARIKILNERLTDFRIQTSTAHRVSSQVSANEEPAKKFLKVASNPHQTESLDTKWQKEIEELQAMRKDIFMKSLRNQSQAAV